MPDIGYGDCRAPIADMRAPLPARGELAFLFIGSCVLEFFGVTVPVLRIAGGPVVAAFAWSVLRAETEPAPHPTPT